MAGVKSEYQLLCEDLEHFETPEWTVPAFLAREKLVGAVYDPAVGSGILIEAVKAAGYPDVIYSDVHDWGYQGTMVKDFLAIKNVGEDEFTIFMNPPFSRAEEFVKHALALGASKVVCFQRFAWYESDGREKFWNEFSPETIYVCGSRATCWRHDIPKNQREGYKDPVTGKIRGGSSTAHAYYVFNPKNLKDDPRVRRIYKRK